MDPVKRFLGVGVALLLFLPMLSSQALLRPLLAVAADGSVFAVTTPEGVVQIREVSTGELKALRAPWGRSFRTLAVSTNPEFVELGGEAGDSGTWNWRTGQWSPRKRPAAESAPAAPTATVHLETGSRGMVALDGLTKKLVWKVLEQDEVLAFSVLANRWAAATSAGRVVWGRVSDGVIEQSWFPGHGPVVAVVGTTRQRWIVLSSDFSVALWDGIQGQKLGSFEL